MSMLPPITLKPLPEIPPQLLAETEAFAVLRQVDWFFRQANPTPKLITDTRAAVADFIERYGIATPQTSPPLPLDAAPATNP